MTEYVPNDRIFRNAKNNILNSTYFVTLDSLEDLVGNYFDSLADAFVNYKEELGSITGYMLNVDISGGDGEGLTLHIGNYDVEIPAKTAAGVTSYFSLGQFKVPKYFNNFADYNPYTKIKIFIPMLGFIDVDTNECLDKYIQFRLLVDYATGKGMYIIGTSDSSIPYTKEADSKTDAEYGFRAIATYEVSIGVDMPIGTSNSGELKRNLILGTLKTALHVATAGYSMSLPPTTTTTSTVKAYDVWGKPSRKGARNLIPKMIGEERTTSTRTYNKPVDKSKPISEAFSGSLDTLNSLPLGSSTDRINDSGLFCRITKDIVVMIYRPKIINQNNYFGHLYGRPLGEVRLLNNVSGYTEINSIHFEGEGFETITKAEIAMLEQAFSDGVYL